MCDASKNDTALQNCHDSDELQYFDSSLLKKVPKGS